MPLPEFLPSGAGAGSVPSKVITAVAYTLQLADVGYCLEYNNVAAGVLTIPLFVTSAIPAFSIVELFNLGVGLWTVAITAGGTLRNPYARFTLATQSASAVLRQRAINDWCCDGNLS